MSITVKWDNEDKTILVTTYKGSWNWSDLAAADAETMLHLDSVDHKVDFIDDFIEAATPPLPISHLPEIAGMTPFRHSNAGVLVAVGLSGFAETAGRIFTKVYKAYAKKVLFASTLEEARRLLEAEVTDQAAKS